MRRFTVILLAALALLPVAPAAAKLRVTWPAATTVAPGDQVTVTVQSSRVVRVALLRMTGARPSGVVRARRMRSGQFTAVVPSAGRFLLAVDRGARRFSRVIESVAPPPPPPPPAPSCAERGRTSVEMWLDRASAGEGERFTMYLRNTGETCLSYGSHYTYDRLQNGVWEPLPYSRPGPDYAAAINPGQTVEVGGYVWEELDAGRHRVVKSLGGPEGPVRATAELDVTG